MKAYTLFARRSDSVLLYKSEPDVSVCPKIMILASGYLAMRSSSSPILSTTEGRTKDLSNSKVTPGIEQHSKNCGGDSFVRIRRVWVVPSASPLFWKRTGMSRSLLGSASFEMTKLFAASRL